MSAKITTNALPEITAPARLTFAGLALGLAAGLVIARSSVEGPALALAEAVGGLWLRALQMTILPLVAGLLFTGIVQTVAAAQAGALARRTLALFAAILVGGSLLSVLLVPLLLDALPIPGAATQAFAGAREASAAATSGPVPTLRDMLASLIPENAVAAAASGAMVPLIVFIALFALAATRLPEAQRRPLAALFEALAAAMMVVIGWVLALAPIGVFALALGLAASSGTAAIGALAHYVALVSAMGVLVLIAAYGVAAGPGRLKLGRFARAVAPAQTMALSTQSSLACLPTMLTACRELGVRQTTAEFVLPLAVALFRATSPAMNLAVAIYAARLTGVELTPAALAAGMAVALLTTIGSVSLPGTISFVASVGPIALAMGVPLAPLALLVAVEMLPDVARTVGNVTMDVAVAATADRTSSSPEPV